MAPLNDKVIANTRKVFDACDLNGDGFLDHVSIEELLLDFEAADTAGDGYIEFREFVVWWTN
jgi:Ca2+-binding EF-hand superfamily protein